MRAYLRLVASPGRLASPERQSGELASPGRQSGELEPHWNSRGHFFAAAAEAMRRILVDQARRKQADKRGGQAIRHELDESMIAVPQRDDDDVLAVNDALEQLAVVDPVAAQLVRLRFFAGLNMRETSDILDMSVRSAHDIWAYARSWMHREMRPEYSNYSSFFFFFAELARRIRTGNRRS